MQQPFNRPDFKEGIKSKSGGLGVGHLVFARFLGGGRRRGGVAAEAISLKSAHIPGWKYSAVQEIKAWNGTRGFLESPRFPNVVTQQ